MDWKAAVKVGGPSALAIWGFYHLITEYIQNSTIFKNDFWLNIILLTYIFLFFLAIAWWWLKKPTPTKPDSESKNTINDNKINDNEVKLDLNIKAKSITNNTIEKNKIDGSLNIGE